MRMRYQILPECSIATIEWFSSTKKKSENRMVGNFTAQNHSIWFDRRKIVMMELTNTKTPSKNRIINAAQTRTLYFFAQISETPNERCSLKYFVEELLFRFSIDCNWSQYDSNHTLFSAVRVSAKRSLQFSSRIIFFVDAFKLNQVTQNTRALAFAHSLVAR